jgi:hypothetical protein
MLALASDLPAAIVAVQMGITPQTASRWSQFSQRDNSEFVAARADFLPAEGTSEWVQAAAARELKPSQFLPGR